MIDKTSPTSDKRPLIALVVVLALAVGAFVLTNRSNDVENASSSTTDTTASNTTATTGSTAPAFEPTQNTSDWQAGLTRINNLENELFQNPDPSRVGEIMLQSCSCYQQTVDRLNALKSAGNHVAGANIVLNDTAFVKQDGDSRVSIFTNPQPAGFPTVDASGNKVADSPNRNKLPFLYILDKGTDGLWRLSDRHTAGAQS